MGQWLTPDSVPALEQKTIMLPANDDFIAAFWGALSLLAQEYNWELFGTALPEDCAEQFRETLFYGFVQPSGGDTMPIGSILWFPSFTPPSGYALCVGQSLDKNTYPDLFAIIGYAFGGSGDNFSLPNLINRFVVAAGDAYNIGDTGGEAEHTLTVAEMPRHAHNVLRGVSQASGTAIFPASQKSLFPGELAPPTEPQGWDTPHNNMPPYIGLAPIIRIE